ncbi:hypothetical protein ACFL6U_05260 [Planctomycetota bacterium]
MKRCYFIDNRASIEADPSIALQKVGGGAVLIYNSTDSTCENTVFAGNSSDYWGGGLYLVGSSVRISDCTFLGCSAIKGGAIAAYKGEEVRVESCRISGNRADRNGGGIYTDSVDLIHIVNSELVENTAASGAGLFHRGKYESMSKSTTKIVNCSLTANIARDVGGALFSQDVNIEVLNSIMWGNFSEYRGHEISHFRGNLDLRYSVVELDNDGITSSKLSSDKDIRLGLFNEDPLFLGKRTVALSANSNCIDRGAEVTDTYHKTIINDRVFDGDGDRIEVVDIGAYEYIPSTSDTAQLITFPHVLRFIKQPGQPSEPQVIAVQSGTGRKLTWQAKLQESISSNFPWLQFYPNNGTSGGREEYITLFLDPDPNLGSPPAHSFHLVEIQAEDVDPNSIQVVLVECSFGQIHSNISNATELKAAINQANDGDIIEIGVPELTLVSNEPIQINNKNLTIRPASKIAGKTIIKCEGSRFNLKYVGQGMTLERLHFQEGNPAVTILGGMPTIKNCDFTDCNQAIVSMDACLEVYSCALAGKETNDQSGVHLVGGIGRFVGCIFSDFNSTSQFGAAVLSDTMLTLQSCTFERNETTQGSGGVLHSRQAIKAEKCIFENNKANAGGGGAIYCTTAHDCELVFCEFEKNTAKYGGAVQFVSGSAQVNSCSFIENGDLNAVDSSGGAIYGNNTELIVTNGLFYGNVASEGGAVFITEGTAKQYFRNCTFTANFIKGDAGSKFGGIYTDYSECWITNCILWENEGTEHNAHLDHTRYSCVSDTNELLDNKDNHYCFDVAPEFQTKVDSDFAKDSIRNRDLVDLRIKRTSPCIDRGYGLTDVYSDVRGSLRPINGDGQTAYTDRPPSIYNDFDIGAYEYSGSYAGGEQEDGVVHAAADVEIHPLAVVGQSSAIRWDNHAGFPIQDRRVTESENYRIDIILVEKDDLGRVIRQVIVEQGVSVSHMRPAEGYYEHEVEYNISHAGTWHIRIAMTNDATQYWDSEQTCRIGLRVPVQYVVGSLIEAPALSDPSVKPKYDDEYKELLFWAENLPEPALYAVGPISTVITWTDGRGEPLPVLISVNWPQEPQLHVANTPSVELKESSGFSHVEIKYSETDAELISDSAFVATEPGYDVLMYGESAEFESAPSFEVVKTIVWDDPNYLTRWVCHVGDEIVDPHLSGHLSTYRPEKIPERKLQYDLTDVNSLHNDDCGSGYIMFEPAPYDASPHVYDRASRTGQIFAVNQAIDVTDNVAGSAPYQKMVVVWYRKGVNGADWPFKPVHYKPEWPKPGDPRCYRIVIASQKGSKSDETGKTYGLNDIVEIYNQPDRDKPGFNPNEEHALIEGAFGDTHHKAVYALREDLNEKNMDSELTYNANYTSKPYVLVRLKETIEGIQKWQYHTYKVLVERSESNQNLSYPLVAGNLVSPPNPLQRLIPLCSESRVNKDDHVSSLTDWYLQSGGAGVNDPNHLVGPFFSFEGTIYARCKGNGKVRWFYPLQEGFWYDLDQNGEPEQEVGDAIPWLNRYSGSQGHTDTSSPYPVEYQISWPGNPPLLRANDTLMTSKEDGKGGKLSDILTQGAIWILHDTYEQKTYNKADPRENDPNKILSQGLPCVRLMDVLGKHRVPMSQAIIDDLKANPTQVKLNEKGQVIYFDDLPFHLRTRLQIEKGDTDYLSFTGYYDDTIATGEPILLPNVITEREYRQIMNPKKSTDHANLDMANQSPAFYFLRTEGFGQIVTELRSLTRQPLLEKPLRRVGGGKKVLLGMHCPGKQDATKIEYVTLAFNADPNYPELPVSLAVIGVSPELYQGKVHRINGDNVFDERSTLRHSSLFGGEPNQWEFEWDYWKDGQAYDANNPDHGDSTTQSDGEIQDWEWIEYNDGYKNRRGLVELTLAGTTPEILEDGRFRCRYWYAGDPNLQSGPSEDALNENWVKRVIRAVNEYDQRVKDMMASSTHTLVSMIAQAGDRYTGPVALNDKPDYLNDVGLIELYTTLLERAKTIAGNSWSGDINRTMLFASGKIADYYMLLGNEAYSDALDPTIGFTTESGDYSAEAPSLFAFRDYMPSLLEEELALLRGQSDMIEEPIHNRLPWNFSMSVGEAVYVSNYGIGDAIIDGVIDERDAKIMYPQAHGDAWGHYLTATQTYYDLLQDPNFTWTAEPESIVLGGTDIEVDYHDESKFAIAAAARARVGEEIMALTQRQKYVDLHAEHLSGYEDSEDDRHWGLFDWATRAGQGAYLDWVVGNAVLPYEDSKTEGIKNIDRTTVTELPQIAACFADIQNRMDKADLGLNPLGLHETSMMFDINPNGLVDDKGQATGSTHFEQIYDRALKSLRNALAAFNYANRNTQSLRKQQDTLEGFVDSIADREADFNSRLIEIYGMPYPDDIGPARTYDEDYTGPDLYHYDYVDDSILMQGNFSSSVVLDVNVYEKVVDDSGNLDEQRKLVPFSVSKQGFGLIRPEAWDEPRAAPGELQSIRSDLLQAKTRYNQLLVNYDNLIKQIEDQSELLQAQYAVNTQEIQILNETLNEQRSLNDAIMTSRALQLTFRAVGRNAILFSGALAKAFPTTMGFIAGLANGVIADPLAPARGATETAGAVINEVMTIAADAMTLNELDLQQSKEIVSGESNIKLTGLRSEHAAYQQLKQLEQLVRTEASQRLELYVQAESLQQLSGRYKATLQRGERLQADLLRFRQQTARKVQTYRYKDMAFRVFRNEAVQKFRAQFDQAAKFTYLACLAYDYETALPREDSMAVRNLLDGVVSERTLGQFGQDNIPLLSGGGLAGILATMNQNFEVLSGQLGFNNPQVETTYFSLRRECFRLSMEAENDTLWRDILHKHYVKNLWDLPAFRRYCKTYALEKYDEPGLVIPFETTITSRRNFFNLPLGPDPYYPAENFATKIRSVGVWFSGYDTSLISPTPYIYLIPVGQDLQRCSVGSIDDVRSWQVWEQTIPLPSSLESDDFYIDRWIPGVDSVPETFAGMRRHGRFRAYPDGGFNPTEMTYNSRLVGRSVWNTEWLLIIPGASLLGEPEDGLERFINGPSLGATDERPWGGVTDIKLFFKTYSYEGY